VIGGFAIRAAGYVRRTTAQEKGGLHDDKERPGCQACRMAYCMCSWGGGARMYAHQMS
jgi:hypothetical protein